MDFFLWGVRRCHCRAAPDGRPLPQAEAEGEEGPERPVLLRPQAVELLGFVVDAVMVFPSAGAAPEESSGLWLGLHCLIELGPQVDVFEHLRDRNLQLVLTSFFAGVARRVAVATPQRGCEIQRRDGTFGAFWTGYMGPAATTWAPMGVKYPYCHQMVEWRRRPQTAIQPGVMPNPTPPHTPRIQTQ